MTRTLTRSPTSEGSGVSGPGKGKKGVYADVPVDVADAFRKYAESRGEKFWEALTRAMRREMAYPPPPPVPQPEAPFPDVKKKRK